MIILKRYFPSLTKIEVSSLPSILAVIALIISPLFLASSVTSLITKVLIFAIFASSLNLLLGYTGLPSLGHAAFFGVGGYTAGIIAIHLGIDNFWIVTPAAILMTAVFAAVIGALALRTTGVYFLLVTLAFGQLLSSVAQRWRPITGGFNGLAGIPYPNLEILNIKLNPLSYYYLVMIVFIICCVLIYGLVRSPFGDSIQGIREDERRMKHLGYNVWLHKYIIFIVSGIFAGIAGVLFAQFNSIMVPNHLGFPTSALVYLMVVIGGESLVFGPVLGAAIVVLLEYYSSLYTPERWPLILGGVFVLAVMFLREGVSVYLMNSLKRFLHGYRGH